MTIYTVLANGHSIHRSYSHENAKLAATQARKQGKIVTITRTGY